MARHIPGPLYYEQIGATGTPMIFVHSTPANPHGLDRAHHQ